MCLRLSAFPKGIAPRDDFSENGIRRMLSRDTGTKPAALPSGFGGAYTGPSQQAVHSAASSLARTTDFQPSGESRRPREKFRDSLPYGMNSPASGISVKIIWGDDLLLLTSVKQRPKLAGCQLTSTQRHPRPRSSTHFSGFSMTKPRPCARGSPSASTCAAGTSASGWPPSRAS